MSRFQNQIQSVKNKKELFNLIEEHNKEFEPNDWLCITKNKYFDISLAEYYAENLDWEYICTFIKLEENDIIKNIKYINWHSVSCFQKLSIDFIRKYKDKLSLNKILTNTKIPMSDNQECWKIFNENNDPKHHKIWDENLLKSKFFCPKFFVSKYNDYPGARDDSLNYKLGRFGELIELTDEEKKAKIKDKRRKITKNKEVENKKPKKEKINNKEDYSLMTKKQLKEILDKRKIRYYYHDTLEILRRKCSESEPKKSSSR